MGIRRRHCTHLVRLAGALLGVSASFSAYALPEAGYTTFGGTGDQIGTGIAVSGTGIYFSGTTAGGTQGVVGQYAPALGPAPVWTRTWGGGVYDPFAGITASGNEIYAAGRSHDFTTDTVGDKEAKGIAVRFNADGSAGGSIAGSVWASQTPSAPGGFPYGGGERLSGVTTAKEGGQNYLYAVGIGERVGFTANYGTFLSKLDETGNVLWSTNDFTFTNYNSEPAVSATGTTVFLAARNDNSGEHPYLKSYDNGGNLQWARTSSVTGEYLGVTTGAGSVFAVGRVPVSSGNTDFLIESWDLAGNLLWTKIYDRNGGEDMLDGVIVHGGHLYAIGSTTGDTAGGRDGAILDIDPLTGSLLDVQLWGGSADDAFADVAVLGSRLYVIGSTNSFGGGASDVAIVSYQLPSNDIPEPGALRLFAASLLACWLGSRRSSVG